GIRLRAGETRLWNRKEWNLETGEVMGERPWDGPIAQGGVHGGRDQVGRGPRVEGVARVSQPEVERLTLSPAFLAVGPAGVEQLGRPARDLVGPPRAMLSGDERVRMMGQEVQVRGDDRHFERPVRVERLAESRQGLAQDLAEPIGILCG